MYLLILIPLLLLAYHYYKNQNVENFSGICQANLDRPHGKGTHVYDIYCGKNLNNANECFPAKAGSVNEGPAGPGYDGKGNTQPNYPSAESVGKILGCEEKDCKAYYLSNEVYYPRYKFWWSHLMDLKTRPPYNRIFPPFWNTYYDPNITSDEYYNRVAADNIMPEARHACQIKAAHDQNFLLRQDIKFDDRPAIGPTY